MRIGASVDGIYSAASQDLWPNAGRFTKLIDMTSEHIRNALAWCLRQAHWEPKYPTIRHHYGVDVIDEERLPWLHGWATKFRQELKRRKTST